MPKLPSIKDLKSQIETETAGREVLSLKFSPFEQSIIDKYKLAAETMILQGNAYEALSQFNNFSSSMVDVYFPDFIEHENTFQKYGHVWLIKYKNVASFLDDSKGVRCIAHLLNKPNVPFLATHLAQIVEGVYLSPEHIKENQKTMAKNAAGTNIMGLPLPDRSYEDKLILQEIAYTNYKIGSHTWVMTKKAFKIGYGITMIELSPDKLFFNYRKPEDTNTGKARRAIGNNIVSALKKIKKIFPELYIHLEKSIQPKHGVSATYKPLPEEDITWFINI